MASRGRALALAIDRWGETEHVVEVARQVSVVRVADFQREFRQVDGGIAAQAVGGVLQAPRRISAVGVKPVLVSATRSSVDAVVARAVAAGAMLREPATTFVSGDRYASIRDPFGVRWTIMTRVEDISSEESGRRVSEYFASFSTSS